MEDSLLKAVFMLVAGPLLILAGLYFSIRTEAGRRRAVKTPATVLDSETYLDHGSWYPHIRYRYTVAGREYTSTQVHPPPGRVGGKGPWAKSIVKRYPPGRRTVAYHESDEPGRAFLINRREWLWLVPIGLGVLLICLALNQLFPGPFT